MSVTEYLDGLKMNRESRRREPVYVPEGDCVVFYASDEPCHAVRLDGQVTVYLSDASEDLVGCQVKEVCRTLKKFGPFGIEIVSRGAKKRTTLGMLFMAAGVRPFDDLARRLYGSTLATQEVDLPDDACLV